MSTPPPPRRAFRRTWRPRADGTLTRRRTSWWDHVKWLLLLAIVWLVLVFSLMGDDPIIGFLDACRIEVRLGWWVLALAGIEALHQAHCLAAERSARYNQWQLNRVFGGWKRLTDRKFSAWTQLRTRRLLAWALVIVVLAIVAGKIMHRPPVHAASLLPGYAWHEAPLFLLISLSLVIAIGQFVLIFWFLSRGGVETHLPGDVKTRFCDVWGQDHVLERVKENILFLENPRLVEDHGGYLPGGILLHGPPGTGKALMAEAVAGETGKPYVFVDPAALTSNVFPGIDILKVKSLFRKLRKLALRYGGVVVFFDAADALGRRGAALAHSPASVAAAGCHGPSYLSPDTQWLVTSDAAPGAGAPGPRRDRQVPGALQALLAEMSALHKPKYRILVMMATSMKDALDPAFLRPGRIDRVYQVGYPSKPGRIRTYQGYFARVPSQVTAEEIDKLATMTPYATGATIKDLVNEALIIAVRDGRGVITWPDVIQAKQYRQLGPSGDVDYLDRERHAIAVHEACHAFVAYQTRPHLEIDIATIEKAGDYLGRVSSIRPGDQVNRWRSELESDILVSLASLAGERMFFEEDSSAGVSGDLESATTVASMMEGYFGMGSTISSLSAGQSLQVGPPGGGRGLADRVEDNLNRLFVQVQGILRENEAKVLSLAHALEAHKTLTGEDVAAVLEGQPGPVVDGTPYTDPVFLQELRSYHEAAVRAHRDHGRPEVTLPVPPQLVAAAVAAAGPDPEGDGR
jgi:cell division protease FtsH